MRKRTQISDEPIVKDMKCKARKCYLAEKKICIVLDGLRREEKVAELFRQEGIA